MNRRLIVLATSAIAIVGFAGAAAFLDPAGATRGMQAGAGGQNDTMIRPRSPMLGWAPCLLPCSHVGPNRLSWSSA